MLRVTFLSHELLFSITPSRDIHTYKRTYKFRVSHNASTSEINNNLKDTFVFKTTIKAEFQNRVDNVTNVTAIKFHIFKKYDNICCCNFTVSDVLRLFK